MRILVTMLTLLLLASATAGHADAPRLDLSGEYPANKWTKWEVSNKDVDVRSSPALPTLMRTPRSRWGKVRVDAWPRRWTMPPGYVATAMPVQGNTIMIDAAGRSWLMVDLGEGRLGVARASNHALWAADWEPVRLDARGNYIRTPHIYWTVVDEDPAGINVRMHPKFPNHYEDPRAVWPTTPVGQWPVIGTLPRGSLVHGVRGNLGVIHLTDPDGAKWLMIRFGQALGFVRWSRAFVVPAAGPVRAIAPAP